MGTVTAALLLLLAQADASAMEQVGAPVRDLRAPQVGTASRSVGAAQLTPSTPSTTGSPALSDRAAGRPPASVAIGGADRCDPQGRPLAGCERIIERRSAEFARPRAPEPSGEGRLLGMRPTARMSDARDAADAAARGQAQDSTALQAAAMRAAEEAEARTLERALGKGAAEALSPTPN
jgi:hypothetical protein